MKNRIMKNWMMALVVSVWIPVVQADLIASYGFNDVLTSSDTQAESTAGDFGWGTGVTKSAYSSVKSEGTKSLYFSNAGFNSDTETSAIRNNRYLGFSIAPVSGYQIAVSELSFYIHRGSIDGAGAPDSFSVYTSADSYTTAVAGGTIVVDSDESKDVFTQYALDLSGVSNLQALASSTEFRIYMWSSQGIGEPSERNFRVDNLKLEGTYL